MLWNGRRNDYLIGGNKCHHIIFWHWNWFITYWSNLCSYTFWGYISHDRLQDAIFLQHLLISVHFMDWCHPLVFGDCPTGYNGNGKWIRSIYKNNFCLLEILQHTSKVICGGLQCHINVWQMAPWYFLCLWASHTVWCNEFGMLYLANVTLNLPYSHHLESCIFTVLLYWWEASSHVVSFYSCGQIVLNSKNILARLLSISDTGGILCESLFKVDANITEYPNLLLQLRSNQPKLEGHPCKTLSNVAELGELSTSPNDCRTFWICSKLKNWLAMMVVSICQWFHHITWLNGPLKINVFLKRDITRPLWVICTHLQLSGLASFGSRQSFFETSCNKSLILEEEFGCFRCGNYLCYLHVSSTGDGESRSKFPVVTCFEFEIWDQTS